ncbi:hypothetical protein BH10ACI4_BH10ACI4_19370 [soil metagenome]
MKFLLHLAALLALPPALSQAAAPQKTAPAMRRLDNTSITPAEAESFAQKTLAEAHVTGAQIAILNDGHLTWSYAYGLRSRDPDLPMTTETTTWAASIAKSVFSTYVMLLVERHQFNLDLPIVKQLPQPLDSYAPYKDTASGVVNDPAWPSITPRMLLSHTSGLQNFASIEPDKKMHLHFKPGTQFLYSGEGINLVQFVIEQQFHKPMDELMQAAIFAPLGMTQTGLIYRKEFAANVADRFDRDEKFHAQTKRFPARGAGSMSTSVEDLAHFLTALFSDTILKPSTRKAMFAPYYAIHGLHQFPLAANEPAGTEAAATGLAYGVGWGLLTRTPYGPAFFKEGHGDGAQNYLLCFERRQTCMIVLTNSDNGELAFRALFERLLGDTVTPWEWEGYTASYIEAARQQP